MAIKILTDTEIQQQATSSFNQPELLFPNPNNLYQRRAERLTQLATDDHPFQAYLLFVAKIARAQQAVLNERPIAKIPEKLTAYLNEHQGVKPLDSKQWQRPNEWVELLLALIDKLKPQVNEQIEATLDNLAKLATSELEQFADWLLSDEFERVPSSYALFIWAALSLYWVQLTAQLPRQAKAEVGSDRHTCPVCDSLPVASVVQFGDTQGLRYLHCSLCETDWHMVRAKCSVCDQAGKLDYWSLDDVNALVKAESCGDCQSYLKVMYQDKDPYMEVVADDLASIFLDIEMDEKGFARSGLNPLFFTSENE